MTKIKEAMHHSRRREDIMLPDKVFKAVYYFVRNEELFCAVSRSEQVIVQLQMEAGSKDLVSHHLHLCTPN